MSECPKKKMVGLNTATGDKQKRTSKTGPKHGSYIEQGPDNVANKSGNSSSTNTKKRKKDAEESKHKAKDEDEKNNEKSNNPDNKSKGREVSSDRRSWKGKVEKNKSAIKATMKGASKVDCDIKEKPTKNPGPLAEKSAMKESSKADKDVKVKRTKSPEKLAEKPGTKGAPKRDIKGQELKSPEQVMKKTATTRALNVGSDMKWEMEKSSEKMAKKSATKGTSRPDIDIERGIVKITEKSTKKTTTKRVAKVSKGKKTTTATGVGKSCQNSHKVDVSDSSTLTGVSSTDSEDSEIEIRLMKTIALPEKATKRSKCKVDRTTDAENDSKSVSLPQEHAPSSLKNKKVLNDSRDLGKQKFLGNKSPMCSLKQIEMSKSRNTDTIGEGTRTPSINNIESLSKKSSIGAKKIDRIKNIVKPALNNKSKAKNIRSPVKRLSVLVEQCREMKNRSHQRLSSIVHQAEVHVGVMGQSCIDTTEGSETNKELSKETSSVRSSPRTHVPSQSNASRKMVILDIETMEEIECESSDMEVDRSVIDLTECESVCKNVPLQEVPTSEPEKKKKVKVKDRKQLGKQSLTQMKKTARKVTCLQDKLESQTSESDNEVQRNQTSMDESSKSEYEIERDDSKSNDSDISFNSGNLGISCIALYNQKRNSMKYQGKMDLTSPSQALRKTKPVVPVLSRTGASKKAKYKNQSKFITPRMSPVFIVDTHNMGVTGTVVEMETESTEVKSASESKTSNDGNDDELDTDEDKLVIVSEPETDRDQTPETDSSDKQPQNENENESDSKSIKVSDIDNERWSQNDDESSLETDNEGQPKNGKDGDEEMDNCAERDESNKEIDVSFGISFGSSRTSWSSGPRKSALSSDIEERLKQECLRSPPTVLVTRTPVHASYRDSDSRNMKTPERKKYVPVISPVRETETDNDIVALDQSSGTDIVSSDKESYKSISGHCSEICESENEVKEVDVADAYENDDKDDDENDNDEITNSRNLNAENNENDTNHLDQLLSKDPDTSLTISTSVKNAQAESWECDLNIVEREIECHDQTGSIADVENDKVDNIVHQTNDSLSNIAVLNEQDEEMESESCEAYNLNQGDLLDELDEIYQEISQEYNSEMGLENADTNLLAELVEHSELKSGVTEIISANVGNFNFEDRENTDKSVEMAHKTDVGEIESDEDTIDQYRYNSSEHIQIVSKDSSMRDEVDGGLDVLDHLLELGLETVVRDSKNVKTLTQHDSSNTHIAADPLGVKEKLSTQNSSNPSGKSGVRSGKSDKTSSQALRLVKKDIGIIVDSDSNDEDDQGRNVGGNSLMDHFEDTDPISKCCEYVSKIPQASNRLPLDLDSVENVNISNRSRHSSNFNDDMTSSKAETKVYGKTDVLPDNFTTSMDLLTASVVEHESTESGSARKADRTSRYLSGSDSGIDSWDMISGHYNKVIEQEPSNVMESGRRASENVEIGDHKSNADAAAQDLDSQDNSEITCQLMLRQEQSGSVINVEGHGVDGNSRVNLQIPHQRIFHCEICKRRFRAIESLQMHWIDYQHYNTTVDPITDELHLCEVCNEMLVGLEALDKHIKQQHKESEKLSSIKSIDRTPKKSPKDLSPLKNTTKSPKENSPHNVKDLVGKIKKSPKKQSLDSPKIEKCFTPLKSRVRSPSKSSTSLKSPDKSPLKRSRKDSPRSQRLDKEDRVGQPMTKDDLYVCQLCENGLKTRNDFVKHRITCFQSQARKSSNERKKGSGSRKRKSSKSAEQSTDDSIRKRTRSNSGEKILVNTAGPQTSSVLNSLKAETIHVNKTDLQATVALESNKKVTDKLGNRVTERYVESHVKFQETIQDSVSSFHVDKFDTNSKTVLMTGDGETPWTIPNSELTVNDVKPLKQRDFYKCQLCGSFLPTREDFIQHRNSCFIAAAKDFAHSTESGLNEKNNVTEKTDSLAQNNVINTDSTGNQAYDIRSSDTVKDKVHTIVNVDRTELYICKLCNSGLPTREEFVKHREACFVSENTLAKLKRKVLSDRLERKNKTDKDLHVKSHPNLFSIINRANEEQPRTPSSGKFVSSFIVGNVTPNGVDSVDQLQACGSVKSMLSGRFSNCLSSDLKEKRSPGCFESLSEYEYEGSSFLSCESREKENSFTDERSHNAEHLLRPGQLKICLKKVDLRTFTTIAGEVFNFNGSLQRPIWKIDDGNMHEGKSKASEEDTKLLGSPGEKLWVSFVGKVSTTNTEEVESQHSDTIDERAHKKERRTTGKQTSDVFPAISNVGNTPKQSEMHGSGASTPVESVEQVTEFERALLSKDDGIVRKKPKSMTTQGRKWKWSSKPENAEIVQEHPKYKIPRLAVNQTEKPSPTGTKPNHFHMSKMAQKIFKKDQEKKRKLAELTELDGLPDFSENATKLEDLHEIFLSGNISKKRVVQPPSQNVSLASSQEPGASGLDTSHMDSDARFDQRNIHSEKSAASSERLSSSLYSSVGTEQAGVNVNSVQKPSLKDLKKSMQSMGIVKTEKPSLSLKSVMNTFKGGSVFSSAFSNKGKSSAQGMNQPKSFSVSKTSAFSRSFAGFSEDTSFQDKSWESLGDGSGYDYSMKGSGVVNFEKLGQSRSIENHHISIFDETGADPLDYIIEDENETDSVKKSTAGSTMSYNTNYDRMIDEVLKEARLSDSLREEAESEDAANLSEDFVDDNEDSKEAASEFTSLDEQSERSVVILKEDRYISNQSLGISVKAYGQESHMDNSKDNNDDYKETKSASCEVEDDVEADIEDSHVMDEKDDIESVDELNNNFKKNNMEGETYELNNSWNKPCKSQSRIFNIGPSEGLPYEHKQMNDGAEGVNKSMKGLGIQLKEDKAEFSSETESGKEVDSEFDESVVTENEAHGGKVEIKSGDRFKETVPETDGVDNVKEVKTDGMEVDQIENDRQSECAVEKVKEAEREDCHIEYSGRGNVNSKENVSYSGMGTSERGESKNEINENREDLDKELNSRDNVITSDFEASKSNDNESESETECDKKSVDDNKDEVRTVDRPLKSKAGTASSEEEEGGDVLDLYASDNASFLDEPIYENERERSKSVEPESRASRVLKGKSPSPDVDRLSVQDMDIASSDESTNQGDEEQTREATRFQVKSEPSGLKHSLDHQIDPTQRISKPEPILSGSTLRRSRWMPHGYCFKALNNLSCIQNPCVYSHEEPSTAVLLSPLVTNKLSQCCRTGDIERAIYILDSHPILQHHIPAEDVWLLYDHCRREQNRSDILLRLKPLLMKYNIGPQPYRQDAPKPLLSLALPPEYHQMYNSGGDVHPLSVQGNHQGQLNTRSRAITPDFPPDFTGRGSNFDGPLGTRGNNFDGIDRRGTNIDGPLRMGENNRGSSGMGYNFDSKVVGQDATDKRGSVQAIRGAALVRNWNYLADLYLEHCSQQCPLDNRVLHDFVLSLSYDQMNCGQALDNFIDNVVKVHVQKVKEDPSLRYDQQGLVSIGRELFLQCCSAQNWHQTCLVLDVSLCHKCSFLATGTGQYIVQALSACLNARNPKLAAQLIIETPIKDLPVSQRAEILSQFSGVVQQLCQIELDADAFNVLRTAFSLMYQSGRPLIDSSSHDFNLYEAASQIIHCCLKRNNVDLAIKVYILFKDSHLQFNINDESKRSFLNALCMVKKHQFAKEIFQQMKDTLLFQPQSLDLPRCIVLHRTLTVHEIVLVVKEYLMSLYQMFLDFVRENQRLSPEHLQLSITFNQNTRFRSGNTELPYIPRDPVLLKVVYDVLQRNGYMNPPLVTQIEDDRLVVVPQSLERYLHVLDENGVKQNLNFHLSDKPVRQGRMAARRGARGRVKSRLSQR